MSYTEIQNVKEARNIERNLQKGVDEVHFLSSRATASHKSFLSTIYL